MREMFFNERGVRDLAARLRAAAPSFDADGFTLEVLARMPPLGLNERNILIRDALRARLPADFRTSSRILVAALGPETPIEGPGAPDGFVNMALCAYVAAYGIDDPAVSLPALREMTKRFSAEFAIRPFLDRHTDVTLAALADWACDPNPLVRRLVSEGTRPRLPWGMRLQRFVRDPRPVLVLLELLRHDPELFVRRSVANNLNDIAKDNPDHVVATLRRWKKDPSPETKWLVKHALRTLLKQGQPEALALLGHSHGARVRVSPIALSSKRVRIGETLAFGFTVASTARKPQPLMIDYAVHYRKANGEQRPKVFKLKTVDLAPGASVRVEKCHPFRPIGIRPYYAGAHAIEILINGRSEGRVEFRLLA